jgi:hypothetical protein
MRYAINCFSNLFARLEIIHRAYPFGNFGGRRINDVGSRTCFQQYCSWRLLRVGMYIIPIRSRYCNYICVTDARISSISNCFHHLPIALPRRYIFYRKFRYYLYIKSILLSKFLGEGRSAVTVSQFKLRQPASRWLRRSRLGANRLYAAAEA